MSPAPVGRERHEDQRRARRQASCSQCLERGGVVDRVGRAEQTGRRADSRPVGSCVGDHDEDSVEVAVVELLCDPSVLCLGIHPAGLQLHPAADAGRVCQREVPCASITCIADPHLGSCDQRGGDQGQERRLESCMGGISQRLATRVRPDPDVEAYDRGDSLDGRQRDPRRIAALDPAELRPRDPARRCDLDEGQAGRRSCGAEFGAHPLADRSRMSIRTCDP